MAAGFVSVPVVPTFRGMSKEFSERLEKPAKKSGEAAGKAISDGLGSSVENLERQVRASSSKLQDLDRAYEKSAAKQAAQKEKVEAATLKLQDAEEKYQTALESGDKGLAELAKVKDAKARLIGETEKLEQAEINTRVAEEKHKNQLDDLQGTLSRYDQAQDDLADQLGVTRQELSKMGGEFSDLDAAMDDSSSKAESWGSRFSNMLKPLGKLGGIAVGLAGINSVAGTLQAGFEKVTSIEDTTASLEVLMGSAEDAQNVMQQLEESNQNTPYSFDAWAGAGKNLIAFGVEADKTAGIVTALGEAASASGKGEEALNSMSDAFGKAAASGKISMDTINSLSQGGVQGLTILANEFDVTTEEMQKMISSGQVSAEEGIDALTKGIREGSEGIAGDVASMSGVMGEMAETTSGRLTNMKSAFNNAAKSVLEELNPLIGAAAEKMTDWTYAGIDLFKTYMVPAIHDGIDAAKGVMETIKPALEVTRDVLKSVVEWLKSSAEWILKNKDWISSLAVSVGVLVGSYKLWMQYQKIMAAGGFIKWIMSGVKATKLWTAVTKGAAAAQKALNAVMKANPIGLVITAVTALVAGLTWFFTKTETGKELWSQFMDVLKSGWDAVKDKMSGFFSWAKGLWDSAVQKFGEARAAMAPIIETVQEIAQVIVEKVVGAFTWWAETVFSVFTAVWGKIFEFLGYIKDNFWPVIQSVFTMVGELLSSVWDGLSGAWENIIQPVFNGIWELAQATIGFIAEYVLTPLQEAWQLLSDAIQWAWENVLQPVFQALVDFATNVLWPGLQQVFTWIGDAWKRLSDTFSAVWGWIRDNVLRPMVSFFTDTLWPAIQDALGWIGDKWQWMADTLSTVVNWIYDNVIMFYVDALKMLWDNVQRVINWIAEKWQWMSDRLSDVWNWIYQNVILRAIDGYKNLWQNFLDVVTWISEKWDWMGDQLHKGWMWIDQNVFSPLKSGLDTVQEWFRKGVDGISRVWDGLRAAAARPVKFVIDTVWNNGILKAWNAIADFLPGIDTVNKIGLGELGGYAQGGVTPGYTPGRDVHDFYSPTGGVIHLSGGEAIMRPEWTRAVGGKKTVDRMNAMARAGKLDKDQMAIGLSHGTLGAFANGGVIGAMANIVRAKYPMLQLTSGYRPGDGGMHGAGLASDWSNGGGNTPQQLALAHDIAKTYPGSAELIYDSPGWAGNIKNGQTVGPFGSFYTMAQAGPHHHHVHWAMTTAPNIQFGGGVFEGGNNGGDGGLIGGFFNWIADKAKGIWSDLVDPIKGKIDEKREDSKFWDIPFGFLETIKEQTWSFLSSKFGSGGGHSSGAVDTSDVSGAVADQVETVFARHGFTGAEWEAAKWIIGKESGWNPTATNPSSGAYGLFQFNPMGGNTLASYLPDRNPDPAVQADAGARYIKDRYGSPTAAKAFWEQNGWYADGGIIDLPKLYDQGGWMPHGGMAMNLSGRPEPVFTAAQWSSISDMIRGVGDLVPAIKQQTEAIARAVDDAQAWMAKAGDYNSIEGINARQGVRRLLDLGLDLPGTEVITQILDAEDTLWDSRARAVGHVQNLADKEKALQEARKAAADLADKPAGVSEDDQKRIDDAQKALDDAKAEQAKADSDDARAKAADKVTEAEGKLKEIREEVDKNSEENAQKHADEVTKANDAVAKAEQELVAARKQQAMDLDNIVLVSQSQVKGLIPMAEQFADQLVAMGVPAAAVGAGLAQVTGGLSAMAAFVGPAGITLGMALDLLKVGISIIKEIVSLVKEIVEKVRKARLDALKALTEGWGVVADYANLVLDLQGRVTSLQQALIRGANAQREAEYNLMLAQHDRYIAETEGALKVAEARLALDAEIKRGATIAQLKLMGLHEDWDSYMAYQAMKSQGVLEEWSDAAISALYTYEKARAEALKGEVTARLEHIKAEAALAEAARQNVRNQQDLLAAQERLIRMSAKVAGVNLVEATGTTQVAKLMAEMAELTQAMDKNTLGRWGARMGAKGSYANEYRGQEAKLAGLREALDAVVEETGVSIDRGDLDRTLKLMGKAAYRGGDPMDVLRARMPQLANAETSLRVNEALKPVFDARDQRQDLERQIEDLASEIDVYEKSEPLERTIRGLEYTIKSLEQSANAFAKGNEELRGEYLRASQANSDAAAAAGVDWKLDKRYANQGVHDQIRRETTIHLDGSKMYTADQIDQLLAEVTAGTSADYRVVRSASEVATARRKERV